jgi:hypothetical protein
LACELAGEAADSPTKDGVALVPMFMSLQQMPQNNKHTSCFAAFANYCKQGNYLLANQAPNRDKSGPAVSIRAFEAQQALPSSRLPLALL